MDLIQTYLKELISAVVPILIFVLGIILQSRVKLVWWIRHRVRMLIEETYEEGEERKSITKQVEITSLNFRNAGRAPANEVEIVLNYKPHHINFFPQRTHEVRINPDGRYILAMPSLAPKEILLMDLLCVGGENPIIVNFRCKEHVAKQIETFPQIKYPWYVNYIAAILMLLGLYAAVYILISILQVLVLDVPRN